MAHTHFVVNPNLFLVIFYQTDFWFLVFGVQYLVYYAGAIFYTRHQTQDELAVNIVGEIRVQGGARTRGPGADNGLISL